jgi:hypothetical protein
VEAVRTLRYMRANSWLTILHEYSDRAAYDEDNPIWKEERAAESN